MAARRLVIVMLVLLGISTLAAALVPGPERGSPTATGTIEGSSEGDTGSARPASRGSLVERRLRVSKTPGTVGVRAGDQLRLAVSGSYGDQITIPAFGLTETMTPYAPARFDVLVAEQGSFPIRAEQSGLVGWIVVRPASSPCAPIRRPARRERSRPRACDRRGRGAASAGVRSDRKP